MRTMTILLLALALVVPSESLAAGGISHILMAHQASDNLTVPTLKTLLKLEDNAYSVGACYADSGYVGGATFGELSHWDPFVFAFADHLKARYADPIAQAPQKVAFLMGLINHRVSDEIFHWVFLYDVAAQDFQGDWTQAHSFGDLGLDIIVTVDQGLWLKHPTHWYVPVTDLVATYREMGYHITTKEIVQANALYYFAGVGERLMAPVTYAKYKRRGPWASRHYLDDQAGGYRTASAASARYMEQMWTYLQDPYAARPTVPTYSRHRHHEAIPPQEPILRTNPASLPLQSDIVEDADGSVEISKPRVTDTNAYLEVLDNIAHDEKH